MSMFHELMMRKKEEIMYATIKGTLTESPEGVFSGFAYNKYLVTQEEFDYSKDFEIVLKMNTGYISVNTNLRVIARSNNGSDAGNSGFAFGLEGTRKKIQTYIIDTSGSLFVNGGFGTTVFDNNADYFFKFSQKLNNGTYTIKIDSSTDGTNWITENTWTHSLPIRGSGQGIAFGGGGFSSTTQYWAGSIDLNNSYIKLGSTKYKLQAVVGYTVVGSPTITDGVVSGFSSANYLQIAQTFPSVSSISKVQEQVVFTTGTIGTQQMVMGGNNGAGTFGFELRTNGKLLYRVAYTTTNNATKYAESQTDTILTENTKYKAIGSFDIDNLVVNIKLFNENNVLLDDKNFIISSSVFSSLVNAGTFYIGSHWHRGVFTGSIYLNNTDIVINNKLWFNGQQA